MMMDDVVQVFVCVFVLPHTFVRSLNADAKTNQPLPPLFACSLAWSKLDNENGRESALLDQLIN